MQRLILLLAIVTTSLLSPLVLPTGIADARTSGTCFLSGERTSGQNRICYYDCLSGERAITIDAVKLCPLSIKD